MPRPLPQPATPVRWWRLVLTLTGLLVGRRSRHVHDHESLRRGGVLVLVIWTASRAIAPPVAGQNAARASPLGANASERTLATSATLLGCWSKATRVAPDVESLGLLLA